MSYVPWVESNTNITFMFHSPSICCKQTLVLFLYSKTTHFYNICFLSFDTCRDSVVLWTIYMSILCLY